MTAPGNGGRTLHIASLKIETKARPLWGGLSGCRKSIFASLSKFFGPLKSSEKLMIENERNPSWVPLVTLFLPVEEGFTIF